jgi:hypothetical protein
VFDPRFNSWLAGFGSGALELERSLQFRQSTSSTDIFFIRYLTEQSQKNFIRFFKMLHNQHEISAGLDPIVSLEQAALTSSADVLHLVGLDQALSEDRDEVLARLNTGRDRLARLRRAIVLWVRPAAYMALGSEAPDFFNWRSGTYEINPARGYLVFQELEKKSHSRPSQHRLSEDLITNYYQYLQLKLRTLDLRGIYDAGEPLILRFTDMYVPLYVESVFPYQWDNEEKGKPSRGFFQREVMFDAWHKERCLHFIGEAGSGKSTGLRHIALQLAKETPNFLPVLVRLEELGVFLEERNQQGIPLLPLHVLERIEQALLGQGAPLEQGTLCQAAEAGQLVLLADGLDEIADPSIRAEVTDLLVRISETFPHAGLIVTLRPHADSDAGIAPPGGRWRVLPFDAGQKKTFVETWAKLTLKDQWSSESSTLLEELSRVELAGSLADRPLLLWAVTLVYFNRRELPPDRARLFGILVDALLKRRDSYDLTVEQKRHLLQEIAWVCLQDQQTDLSRDRMIQVISDTLPPADLIRVRAKTPDQVLELLELQSGLLVRSGLSSLRFSHLVYQEYLAARRMVDHEPNLGETLCQLVRGQWWQGPAILALEHLSSAARVLGAQALQQICLDFSAGKAQIPCLLAAAQAMLDLSRDLRGREDVLWGVREQIIAQLLAVLARRDLVPMWRRFEAGKILGLLGDPRVDQPQWARVPGHPRLWISCYPIVNQQYTKFIEGGGYTVREWWTQPGWIWKNKRKRSAPEAWGAEGFNFPNAPVAGVCQHEAEAFLRWAGKEWKIPTVRLPNVEEWDAAAAACVRKYPWGDEFDPNCCNTLEAGLGHPSPIGVSTGATPTDPPIEELFGNVREWTNNAQQNRVVLKGFSYADVGADYRSSDSFVQKQGRRWYHRFGFRPVFSSPDDDS